MKKIFLLLLTLLSLQTFAQKNVYHLPLDSNQSIGKNSFMYVLPQTAFKIEVTIIKTREIKGYYTDYAEKLLGLTNIISSNKTFYKLKNTTITPITVLDTNQIYAVNLSSKQIKNNYLTQLYNHINNPIPAIPFEPTYTINITPIPDFFKNYANVSYTEKEDAYVETKIINGVVTQVPANRTRIVSKTAQQQVQEAADLITKTRKDRYDIAAGAQEVPYSKEALELLMEELKQWEKNYLDLFTGISVQDEIHYTFIITPKVAANENELSIPIFSIDQDNGFSQKINLSKPEQNYYLNLTSNFSNNEWNKLVKTQQNAKKPIMNNGYRIRKAVPVTINLINNKQIAHSFGIFPIFQFGKIEVLPVEQDQLEITKYVIIY